MAFLKNEIQRKLVNNFYNTDINDVENTATDNGFNAVFVDEKIDDGLDNGDYLMMRSYNMTYVNGDKYYVRFYYPRKTGTITFVDAKVENENVPPTPTSKEEIEKIMCKVHNAAIDTTDDKVKKILFNSAQEIAKVIDEMAKPKPLKIAKDIAFCPMLRVVMPNEEKINGYTQEEFAMLLAQEKLMAMTKKEIIEWVMDNFETMMDSPEEYDGDYDE